MLLTIIGSIVIYILSSRITKDLNMMAHLLLKIDKKPLFVYLTKFEKVFSRISKRSQEKYEEEYENATEDDQKSRRNKSTVNNTRNNKN
jgi:hypothetical protein